MDPALERKLMGVYEMLKAGQKAEAYEILASILKANPNSAEAWYLMGFAVTDLKKKEYSFRQVLRIDPGNTRAQQQLEKLSRQQELTTPRPHVVQRRPKAAVDPVRRVLTSPLTWIGAVMALVVMCVGVWLLTRPRGVQPLAVVTAPPDAVQNATALPTFVPHTPQPSPTPPFNPVFRPKGCPFDTPLGVQIRCGVVSVPQNREKNYTDLIELPVAVYESTRPGADTIIYLQGGPGEETLDWAQYFYEAGYIKTIVEDYNIIFFDPRGMGRSQPALECPELNGPFLDAFFQNRSNEDAYKDFLGAWILCNERFKSQGVDPAAFNTTQSAADAVDIVHALGHEKVNLLGISYGTRIGLTIMRDHPEIVRAAVLDSVVPMEGKMFNRVAFDVQEALDKMFNDCAANPRCNAAYPDLRNMFNGLLEKFRTQQVKMKVYDPYSDFDYEVNVNDVDLITAMVWGMRNSELVPVVPKAIYDIHNGDYTFLAFALGLPGGTYGTMGMGTYFATVCPEQVYVTTPQEMDAELSISPVIKAYSLAGAFGSTQRLFDLCNAWGAHQHTAIDSQPVTADIPTLVFSGQYDPVTPVSTGQIAARSLPRGYFYAVPGMGHAATVDNDCAMNIMKQFLENPNQEPNAQCLQNPFEFFLPYTGETPVQLIMTTDTQARFSGGIPAGWRRDLPYSTYVRDAYLFDPTLLDFLPIPGTVDQVVYYLTTSYDDNGFDVKPKRVATHAANGHTWYIYETKYNGEAVIFAVAQVNSYETMIILLVTSGPERDGFYKGMFIPMLDTIEILR